MATIFISSKKKDTALAGALRKALEKKGHVLLPDRDSASGKQRMDMLGASDAVVPLLTEEALSTNLVMSEIGAARAFAQTRPVLLLPVIVGAAVVPRLIADTEPVRLKDVAAAKVGAAANKIDALLAEHLKQSGAACPRVFISHRHKEKELVKALVQVLEAAFYLKTPDIRCTSVPPYQLKPGRDIDACIRSEISRTKVVLGVLTPDTKESGYVLFELGASWGQDVSCVPLLAKGATLDDIPPPIRNKNAVDLADESDCLRLIDALSREAGLQRREESDPRVRDEIRTLALRAAPARAKD